MVSYLWFDDALPVANVGKTMRVLRVMVGAAAAAIALSGATGLATAQAAGTNVQPIAAYALVAPNGVSASGLIARAVVPQGVACPKLQVTKSNGSKKSVAMHIRKAPTNAGSAFAGYTACTVHIPAHATDAHIGRAKIPAAMPSSVKQMAVFGDTGCRIKGSTVQNCATPDTWPLAKISQSIANEKPDLVVFTGDFFYREGDCPLTKLSDCGGSPAPVPGMPFKDTAYAWAADVLTPMSPIFAKAPILVTRGNHEACNRGGNGYYWLMDPQDGTENTCAPTQDAAGALTVPSNDLNKTFAADVKLANHKSLRFVVVDSAYGWDCEASSIVPEQTLRYQAAQALAKGHNSWLVVHRPVVGWQPNNDCSPTGGWVSTDQTTASAGLLGDYQLMLSSHIHVAEAVNIPGLPGQLVIGNGGTLLDTVLGPVPTTAGPTFPAVTYPAPTSSWMESKFGYVMATPTSAKHWSMNMHDPEGKLFASCELQSKTITCANK